MTVTGAVGATANKLDQLTITNSGGTTFQSTVDAKTVTLTDTTDATTVGFLANLTVSSGLTVAANGAYHVSLTGMSNSIAGTTSFLNTGTITLGDTNGDSTTFVAGVTATAPSGINLAGTVGATTGASAITLGDNNTPVSVTDNATVGGAATGAIGLGDVTLADGKQLTLGTGIGNALNLRSVAGNAGLGAETLLINTTGLVTVTGAVARRRTSWTS